MADARACEPKAILEPFNLDLWYDSDDETWLKEKNIYECNYLFQNAQ